MAAEPVRLTQLASCTGCSAKLAPGLLHALLSALPRGKPSSQVLVGPGTFDDAAVYRLSKTQAVVQTVDFFPPVVDDPFAYGQIAAANAMSDVWAMGGKALFALNVVAFPKGQPLEVLREILAGGASKAKEAGVRVLGGHSVQSPEPQYGMAVTGLVHPRRVLTNAGGKAGDVLILTKPIGTGIASTALQRGQASARLVRQVTAQMSQLNKTAAEVLGDGRLKVRALTDVSGFGLLGHLLELARGSGLKATLYKWQVPVMEEVPELAEAGCVPSSTRTNLEHVAKHVHVKGHLTEHVRAVLADPQTNGGLLAALPEKQARPAIKALEAKGVPAWVVGELARGKPGIEVV